MNCSSLRLARIYTAATGCRLSTTSSRIAGSGDTFTRLERGHTITFRRDHVLVQRFSDRWPPGATWPADIPRPKPAPGSPPPSGTEAPQARSARPADPAPSGTEPPRARSARPADPPPSGTEAPQARSARPADPAPSGTEPPRARSLARPADPVAAVQALLDQATGLAEAGKEEESLKAEVEARQVATHLNVMSQIASPAALCAFAGCSRQTYYDAIRRYSDTGRACTRKGRMANLVALLRASGDLRFRRRQQPVEATAAAAANGAADALSARM